MSITWKAGSGDVRSSVGNFLWETRERRGLTLAEVERRTAALGFRLPRSTINDIESGRASLPVEAVGVLTSVLGLGTLDLLSRVVVSLGRVRARGSRPGELAERGTSLAREGADLEAAWHFDAAAEMTPDPRDAARQLLNASHAYFMAGAYELSLQRVEDVLDRDDLPPEIRLSAWARLVSLLAALGRDGRARDAILLLRVYRERVSRGRSVAYSLVTEAWAGLALGLDPGEIRDAARRAARLYRLRKEGADAARALCAVALSLGRQGRAGDALRAARQAADLLQNGGDEPASALVAVTRASLARGEGYEATCRELAFAASPRCRLRHRAEALAAWWILEREAVRSGNYAAARRWRRRAATVTDPVTRKLATIWVPEPGATLAAEKEEGR